MANAQLHALEFVENKFGKERLVLDGYLYRIRSQRNSRVYWRCFVNTCPATINTNDQLLVKRGYQHNHTSNQPKTEVMKVLQTMKNQTERQWNNYRLTTPVGHPSTSRDHYPDQPYQKSLPTFTFKGNGA